MAMKTLIFDITWSGPQMATLEYLRDNLVDVIHVPKTGTNGRITLSWPASDELAHDIDWDLWAAGSTLKDLKAVARWKDTDTVHALAEAESSDHRWRSGGRL